MFVPNKKTTIGQRVELLHDVKVMSGTFTKGSILTIVSDAGQRGWNLKDDEGNNLLECSSDTFKLLAS